MQVAAQAPPASTLRMYRWLILGNVIVLRTFRNSASRSALRGRLGASMVGVKQMRHLSEILVPRSMASPFNIEAFCPSVRASSKYSPRQFLRC